MEKIQIMDLPMQALFCQQIMADDIDVWKGHVIATVQECTECYYGSMLLQDIIVHEFSFEEVKDWMANELGYTTQDFQAMLDFYSLEPQPDPKWDPSVEQLADAICFAGADRVEYEPSSKCFLAQSYIQKPWRDSGGAIDAIDVEVEEHRIPLKEAMLYWEEMNKDLWEAGLWRN